MLRIPHLVSVGVQEATRDEVGIHNTACRIVVVVRETGRGGRFCLPHYNSIHTMAIKKSCLSHKSNIRKLFTFTSEKTFFAPQQGELDIVA